MVDRLPGPDRNVAVAEGEAPEEEDADSFRDEQRPVRFDTHGDVTLLEVVAASRCRGHHDERSGRRDGE